MECCSLLVNTVDLLLFLVFCVLWCFDLVRRLAFVCLLINCLVLLYMLC